MAFPPNRLKSPVLRGILIVLGTIFLGLAFLGIFLPLLPTTPFLLAAGACYSRSSSRFYNWLLTNRLFGHYIRDYKEKKGIPMRVKIGTLIFLWASILSSVLFLIETLWVQLVLIAIAAGVTIHIALIRTNWHNGKM